MISRFSSCTAGAKDSAAESRRSAPSYSMGTGFVTPVRRNLLKPPAI